MLIEVAPEAEASAALAEYYRTQRERWGFLPNYAAAFAPRPAVATAWARMGAAVVVHMDRRRYELASIAAARALGSTYCTIAHATFLRDLCHDEATLEALIADPSGGRLGEEDRAVFEFATKVAVDATSVDRADIEGLRAVGLSDTDIADVVYAVAARAFFTRVLDGLGALTDLETAATFDDRALATMIVGRPVGPAKTES
ncbi:carboxymuconolactone decarboxylase family protein [Nocardioides insulae]|uniref:carboxymuconolactone decarboxylase family protein n=1 Tax=Nocardioides insulae TaxID=394734 RepID=UPI0004013E2E|nr:peroxidase-related enzyme [Nocardioides insulae]